MGLTELLHFLSRLTTCETLSTAVPCYINKNHQVLSFTFLILTATFLKRLNKLSFDILQQILMIYVY